MGVNKHIENYLREFVYGGMDGSVTTFAVVTGAAGANLSSQVILILGFANVFADGFSMAVGSYLSEKSTQELEKSKGKNSEYESPLKASIATFISFVAVGFIPLSVYTFDYVFNLNLSNTLLYSIILTLMAFGIIGYLRGTVSKTNRLRTITESLALGTAAAIISYVVGSLLEKLIH